MPAGSPVLVLFWCAAAQEGEVLRALLSRRPQHKRLDWFISRLGSKLRCVLWCACVDADKGGGLIIVALVADSASGGSTVSNGHPGARGASCAPATATLRHRHRLLNLGQSSVATRKGACGAALDTSPTTAASAATCSFVSSSTRDRASRLALCGGTRNSACSAHR